MNENCRERAHEIPDRQCACADCGSAAVAAGFDAIHVPDRGQQSAADIELVELATREDRIVVSADTDHGTILTLRQASKPSFILFRGDVARRPDQQVEILVESLPRLDQILRGGAIVAISAERIRVRRLPVQDH